MMSDLFPQLEFLLKTAKDNAAKWKEYEETEKDKQVYSKMRPKEI